MQIFDIHAVARGKESLWRVLGGTDRSEVAVMVLGPGEASSSSPSVHAQSDQILYLIEGQVKAEIAGTEEVLKAGQLVLVPAGAPHLFVNESSSPARTLNVYAPPFYT